jgi:hypothetical protein
MATVHYVTSSSGLRKFQAAWFLLHRVYTGMMRLQTNMISLTYICSVHRSHRNEYIPTPHVKTEENLRLDVCGCTVLCTLHTKKTQHTKWYEAFLQLLPLVFLANLITCWRNQMDFFQALLDKVPML